MPVLGKRADRDHACLAAGIEGDEELLDRSDLEDRAIPGAQTGREETSRSGFGACIELCEAECAVMANDRELVWSARCGEPERVADRQVKPIARCKMMSPLRLGTIAHAGNGSSRSHAILTYYVLGGHRSA